MIYTSEILLPVIAQAESYFARLLNDNIERLEKGKKPINLEKIEKLWLYKEALAYANDLELYDSELTTKIYSEVMNLIAGHQVTITINDGEISNPALDYYLIGDPTSTPLATSLIFGKVRLSVPAAVSSLPIVVGDNDPRLTTYTTAYDRSITGIAFNTLGKLVLTKQDTSALTSVESLILNQFAAAQTASLWISGNAKIEGTVTLSGLTDPGTKDYIIVADSSGNLYRRTKAELASDLSFGGYTADRVIVTNGSGALTSSTITTTELGQLLGVSSNIQSQIDGKQAASSELTAIAGVSTNGFMIRNSSGTYSTRLLTAGTGISISHGTGTSGATTITNTQTQYTNAMARAAISSSATGLSYNNTTGVFTLTSGYSIPTTTQITNWTSAYNNMLTAASFDVLTGEITLTQQDAGTIVVDLDGRYLLGNETINLAGDVTGSGSTAITTTIANDAVTFAKMQNVSTGILLGRSSSSTGNIEELTIGSGLTLSTGALSLSTLTANRAVITNSSGVITASSVTNIELGYLAGVTSAIQTQIDNKQSIDATLTALSAIGSSTIGIVVLNGIDSFTTRILDGTANRITVNNGNGSSTNPSIDIASTYVGQSTITTLGTITSGSWASTPIADAYVSSSSNWNTAYNSKINALSFNTSTGYLTATKQDSSTVTASLDGRYLLLSGGTMTGDIVLAADPTIALHAATKQYVDNIATGIKPKGDVEAATTTTLPSYTGATQTLTGTSNGALAAQDGVTLIAGDYLLVKNETGASEKYNGIYQVTQVGDAFNPYELTRAANSNTWDELINGSVYIAGGTTLQGYTYYCTATSGGTLGTTAVTFVVLSSSTIYLAGTGIDIVGSTISIETGGITNNLISASAAIDLSKLATLTANRLLISDGTGLISASSITSTEVGYLSGITSSVQTQLSNKQPLDATLTSLAGLDSAGGIVVQTGADLFTKRTISGVTNRTTVTNGDGVSSNPTIDISASYIGQNTITTLGTITTGVWAGTAIGDTYISSATNWNTAYNNMIASASFNTADGILTLTQQDAGTVTVDLDGRYLLGNETVTLSGEASGTGATSISVTLSNSAVLGKVLTGYISGAGTVAATDTILQAIQKLNGNISALVTGVSSVSGTSNRITSTGGATPVIDIAATYVGQTSITTLGTISSGIWQGTAIADTYISSASNWNTAYTNRITSLTVTGSSGAATLTSNTLNIPTYTLAGLGGQPLDATLTALAAFNSNGIMVQTAADTFTSRTITGTTNRLDVTNGSGVSGNPTLDISASYVGQTSITTLGTIGSGVWQGTAVADTYIASATNWNAAYNNMIVSASFGTGDGVLTLTQQDSGTVTVDLDGRYALGSSISGTNGTIPVFGSSNSLGDSIITQSSGSINIAQTGANYSAINTGAKTTIGLPVVTNVNLAFGVSGAGSLGSIIQSRDNVSAWYLSLNPFGGQIITANAADTGEHFIIGGSARVNGTMLVTGAATFSSTLQSGSHTIAGVGNALFFDTTGLAGAIEIKTVNDYELSLKTNRGSTSEIRIGNVDIDFFTNSVSRLKIASTGAATFSSSITSTLSSGEIFRAVSGTTGPMALRLANTGANAYWGLEGSTAGGFFTGSSAYATVLYSDTAQEFIVSATKILTLNTSGSAFTTSVTASSFVKSGGTSSEFLKANGTVDTNTYLTTSSAASTYQPLDATLTALAALNTTAGLLVQTGTDTFTKRTLTAGTGITITNGDGVSGNPTVAVTSTYAIQNQIASAQTANFWISGDAKVNGKVYIGTNGAYFEEVLVGGLYKIQVTDSAGNTTIL